MSKIKAISIGLLSCLFLLAAMPQLSAKHHGGRGHRSNYRSSSFALNFNLPAPAVSYYSSNCTYQPVPAPVYYNPYYQTYYQPYPVYTQTVVAPPVYVQPSLSFYSSWGWGR